MPIVFTKEETDTEVIFTGSDEADGVVYILQKDDQNLDVRVKTPLANETPPQTWQDVAGVLDLYVPGIS